MNMATDTSNADHANANFRLTHTYTPFMLLIFQLLSYPLCSPNNCLRQAGSCTIIDTSNTGKVELGLLVYHRLTREIKLQLAYAQDDFGCRSLPFDEFRESGWSAGKWTLLQPFGPSLQKP